MLKDYKYQTKPSVYLVYLYGNLQRICSTEKKAERYARRIEKMENLQKGFAVIFKRKIDSKL